jgi:CheY-like chemotaxis protein/uncharacterized protein with HEPN domain
MTAAHDVPFLKQLQETARIVAARMEGDPQLDDPLVADAVLWRISIIAQAADRLSPELVQRHPQVDWSGVQRLRRVADGTLGGLTREEVWTTVPSVLPALQRAVESELEAIGAEAGESPEKIRRVLLVDDDPDIRRILDLLLTHAGFAVIQAGDGVEALDRIKGSHPDAVVADVQMPNMDGIELLRRLRSTEEMKHVPVLLFTGKPPIDNLPGVLSMDRVRYMSKGDPKRVIFALESMLAEAVPGMATPG